MRIFILYFCFFSFFIFGNSNHINIHHDFANFVYKKQYNKALKIAQKHLLEIDDNPNLGDLADSYVRLCIYLEKNPAPFLSRVAEIKKDYITKERIVLAIADYHNNKKHYYSAIKYYRWIERNHNSKSLVYDDALWSLYNIFKRMKAYTQALHYLNIIINTHQYSIYVGSYNQFHFYDAFLEKYKILLKLNRKSEAIRTLNIFIDNFSENPMVDDAFFELCKIQNRNYCCKLLKKYPYSSHFITAKALCPSKIKIKKE